MSRKEEKRFARALAKVEVTGRITAKGYKVVLRSGSVVRFSDPEFAYKYLEHLARMRVNSSTKKR